MVEERVVLTLTNAEIGGEKRGTDELGKDQNTSAGHEHTPKMGMVFQSYEEVVNFYKRYALRVGFGVSVRKSSFTTDGLCRRLVLVCTKGGKGRANECYQSRPTAKTNCQATLIVKLWGDGLLHVVEANLEHNHQLNPSAARLLRCYKKMSSGKTKDLIMRGGPENSQFSDKECMDFVEGERLKLGEGDNEALYQFFAQMQAKQPNFFYLMDMDIEGHLRNVFWADARSRAAYQYFNDVVYFDTTYLRKNFDVPLAYFGGVNHHGQLVLLGCGLLSNESSENYNWLFKAWLTCMRRPPNAIVTDWCNNIHCAVNDVLPEVRHGTCLWHVMECITEKLRGFTHCEAFKKELEMVASDSFRVQVFEESWTELIRRYAGLEGNRWLNSLFESRQLWAPVFLKDTFWGGLAIFQRNKSIDVFFDESLCLNTSLKEFFSKYEIALHSKYKMEAQANFDTFHKSQLSVSKFHMEELLSKLYTLNIFKKFQEELKATVYCHVSLLEISDPMSRFEIKESAHMEDTGKVENKQHEVLYKADELVVQCTCGSFQSRGILCRHSLSVLQLQQVYEIPPQYIVSRWRKDFKQLHALAHPSNDVVGSNRMEPYDYLSFRCLHLAECGLMSDDKYQLALELIREVEKSLLDDYIFQDLKRRLPTMETRSNENNENLVASQFGIFRNNKNHGSKPPKRRGRPPKRKKESETMFTTIKGKDFVGTPLMASQSDAIQGPSTASHLGTNTTTHGGLDLMEEVSPNELSFGAPFDVNVNHYHHHHHSGNESGLQSADTSQYGHQAVGGESRVQWVYQQMLQENQAHFSRRTQ